MNIYKWVVEIFSTAVLASLATCCMLGIGLGSRILWEGLKLGFTLFGYWP